MKSPMPANKGRASRRFGGQLGEATTEQLALGSGSGILTEANFLERSTFA
jgi:hypothetical protein